jgi:hypothetical protein
MSISDSALILWVVAFASCRQVVTSKQLPPPKKWDVAYVAWTLTLRIQHSLEQ